MRRLVIFILFSCWFSGHAASQPSEWEAKRITFQEAANKTNTWIDYRRDLELDKVPEKALARIACDSKYWLWINGEMVVFEGQLKRGPTPEDTYYDKVNIAPFLRQGHNTIAVLVWFFGKDGFSHNNSGEAGLVFECKAIGLFSDESWLARLDPGYGHTGEPRPNFRLPESNVKFDARKGDFEWTSSEDQPQGFSRARVQVPHRCKALVYTPVKSESVVLNGTLIYDTKPVRNAKAVFEGVEDAYNTFLIGGGSYEFQIHKKEDH